MNTIKDAQFIRQGVDMGENCPIYKKVIWLDKKINTAKLYISALGIYEAYLNDKRVGKSIFAPGWANYQNRLQYQEYNVTQLLEECNVLDIAVGNGRCIYNKKENNLKNFTSNETALIAALVVEYDDGTSDFFPTDETWECRKSNVIYSDICDGETVDFTADTDEKYNVKVVNKDKNILIENEGEDIREIARLSPVKIFKTPKGERVIDFGQNIAGYVEWIVPKRKGKTFKLCHAEALDENGDFYTDNFKDIKCEIQVTSDGNERIYKPHFTYQGFRYVKLVGFCDEDIKEENFSAIVIMSDMKRTGFFACGDDDIQQLYENIIWGQRGNFIDVPTNCPQRNECLGSVYGAQLFCRTASINYKTDKFFKKWLNDLNAHLKDNGFVSEEAITIYNYGEVDSALRGEVCVIVPYWLYRTYGEKSIIENQFDFMKKWMDFMESKGYKNGMMELHNAHYGDLMSLEKVETDKNLIAAAFFAYSNSLFIKMGKAIGKDMSYYEDMYNKTIIKYRKNFINTGKAEHLTQTALVLDLYFNLTENRKRESDLLIKNIETCGHLKTGIIGTAYLLHVLRDIGRVDLAYKLLLRREYPSWIYPITKGATTIWERWNSIKSGSSFNNADTNYFNNCVFGSVGDFLYNTVAGIDSDFNEPGYKHIIFKPYPIKNMQYAKARILTDNGEIVSSWEYTGKGNECKFSFTIPKGSHATLYLDNEEYEFGEGTYTTEFDYES